MLQRILIFFLFIVCLNKINGQTVLHLNKSGGVYTVPCLVNGLPLEFIFDTGASGVVISLIEASFMLKHGYLSEDDILGSTQHQIADGSVSEGTSIILRKLVIGDIVLYDVEASIVHTLGAPLLLGQSAISRFGRFEIDYYRNELIIWKTSSPNSANIYPVTSNEELIEDVRSNAYKAMMRDSTHLQLNYLMKFS